MSNSRQLHKLYNKLHGIELQKYEQKYTDTLLNSVPKVFRTLEPIATFLKAYSVLFSINIKSTSYIDKYLNLNGDSINNQILS